jgi:acyl carrier protein
LDSLDYVDLVVLIDEHFGFKVMQEEFATMRTFQDFFDFIIAKGSTRLTYGLAR